MRVPWNEDMRVKFPATVQFMRLGYEYQSLKDADIHPETRIFLNRFVPAIQRINRDKNLTVEQILATIEEIHGIIKNNDMGKEFLGRLLDQTADIKLIDFDHPEDNDFAVVDELTFGPEAKGSFRPDINILVNGIPLGFLEVKKPNNEGGIQKEFHRMLDERLQVPEFKKYFNMLQFVTFSNNMEYETDNDAAPAEEVRAGSFYSTPNGNRTFFSFFREENPKTSGFKEIYMDEVRYILKDNGYSPSYADVPDIYQCIKDTVAENGYPSKLSDTICAMLRYMKKNNLLGACHATASAMYVALSEQGFKTELCVGEIGSPDMSPFDHSWVTVDDKVIDLACYMPLPNSAGITNASYPIVLSTDVVTKSTPKLTYGVETGLGFDFQTQQLLRMPFVDYLDNYPFEKNGLWTVIQRISPVPINYRTLREKYSNVQRKICK